MGGIGLGLNLLDWFHRELKDPLAMLFIAVHTTPCLSVLPTAWVDGVIVCLCIMLEKRRQCGCESGTHPFADPSVLAEGGSGCRVLCAKLMSGGMPGLCCSMAIGVIPRLLAK